MVDDDTAHGGDGWDALADPQRVLPDEQLASLGELSTEELRRLRSVCEAAEEGVSYARRLLQGRLDILRAELADRDDTDHHLLDVLPRILTADPGGGGGQARALRLRVPPDAEIHTALIDEILDEGSLQAVDGHDHASLSEVAERLAEHESRLSSLRRAWFTRIDAVRDELAARYKDGRADVREFLR